MGKQLLVSTHVLNQANYWKVEFPLRVLTKFLCLDWKGKRDVHYWQKEEKAHRMQAGGTLLPAPQKNRLPARVWWTGWNKAHLTGNQTRCEWKTSLLATPQGLRKSFSQSQSWAAVFLPSPSPSCVHRAPAAVCQMQPAFISSRPSNGTLLFQPTLPQAEWDLEGLIHLSITARLSLFSRQLSVLKAFKLEKKQECVTLTWQRGRSKFTGDSPCVDVSGFISSRE